jgi:hypothetical protein
VQNWIADEHSRYTVKNTIAVLVRAMEQAVRDGVIKVNPARVTGRQKLHKQAEDELLDPRALALPDSETLVALADALVAASHDQCHGWGDVVVFAACTTARIGEVSDCRVRDIDTTRWIWTVRLQVHVPRHIAGHGSLTTTQRYLHPDVHKVTTAGAALSAHLSVLRASRSPPNPIVVTR